MPLASNIRVVVLSEELKSDFFSLHQKPLGDGWCFCSAWWVETWEGWNQRSAEDNLELRRNLFARGIYDGYLAYIDENPGGWCQVGLRNRLEKLNRQLALEPDLVVYSITCFQVLPSYRRQGIARVMLRHVIEDLRDRGILRLEAFPKRNVSADPAELWNGPEKLFLQEGFVVVREDALRPVLALDLRIRHSARSPLVH